MNTDEADLIAALQRRDAAALATLFETYANRIYRLAAGMLRDEQQADGVVQDTFLKLIEHIDQFQGRASIGTWLYRVAYHEVLGRLRRARPMLNLDDLADDADYMPAHFTDWQAIPEARLTSQEAAQQMQQAIDALPQALRVVFIMRDVEELSTHAVADALNLTEAAVKVRLHRARLLLRERLSAYFEEYV